ncbi:MAG: 30S ribosomal protein S20 [Spirochaetales bacterium]|nr:MAG: 30S ribosomal protein S20 [Spirochaetales bacterium]
MATKQSSAEKRHLQDEKSRIRNKQVKSSVRTAVKKVVTAAHAKDKAAADATLKEMISQIDTAARKGIIKKNNAARKKSRMQRLVNLLGA